MSSIRHKSRDLALQLLPRRDSATSQSTLGVTMPQTITEQQIAALEKEWATNPRWKGIKRGYSAADVVRLRGSFPIEYTLARRGAEKLWELVNNEPYVNCLGALTGGQAM